MEVELGINKKLNTKTKTFGYKAFNKDLTNRYGAFFNVGESYSTSGEIKFGNDGNGFHFCMNLCDVFRYFDSTESVVAIVSTEDVGRDLVVYNDEYNGYYDMYSCRNIKIERLLTRRQIIDKMLCSVDFEIIKFIQTFKLTKEESYEFLKLSQPVIKAIEYYQLDDTKTYTKF